MSCEFLVSDIFSFTVLGKSATCRLLADSHSQLDSLKRGSVSLNLAFIEDILLTAHVQ